MPNSKEEEVGLALTYECPLNAPPGDQWAKPVGCHSVSPTNKYWRGAGLMRSGQ